MCFDRYMTDSSKEPATVVQASKVIEADAERLFEFIADPARQPLWDGNDNLADAEPGQRVRGVGDVFTMALTSDSIRHNRVVEFIEGRLIAWLPAEPGREPRGHLWRWELEPIDAGRTNVRHTYDWSNLTDPSRLARARATTAESLQRSLDRLAVLAESK